MSYRVLLSASTEEAAGRYLADLTAGSTRPGARLGRLLANTGPPADALSLLELLLRTKQPQIFAESDVAGDGSDWNASELELLGEISIAADVRIFDDGAHVAPMVHDHPFAGTLVFTCGALLRNDRGVEPPDLARISKNGHIDQDAYAELYRRRLLPVFLLIDGQARQRGRGAVVTIPGLGCGQFAGGFRGTLGPRLQAALQRILLELSSRLTAIDTVIFDPHDECTDQALRIGGITFRVRPLRTSTNPRPQLCQPVGYAEPGDDFSGCDLYSLVAWDQVSWPGNDFYLGQRSTDDGVKAAATSAMAVMTGIEGTYDRQRCQYRPPGGYRNWLEVVSRNDLELSIGQPYVAGY